MKEELILVDEQDVKIGTAEKIDAHIKGLLHRAFSLFILDTSTQKLLLQQRALDKYHSGGLWTNACCSHPRKDEKLLDAVCRRVKDELGISVPDSVYEKKDLWECNKFTYRKDYGKYIEHEIDHVFIWSVDKSTIQLVPNKDEVDDILWIDISVLEDWMTTKPEDFTAWVFPAYEIFINDVLSNTTMMRSPISSSLFDVIQKKKNEVLIF